MQVLPVTVQVWGGDWVGGLMLSPLLKIVITAGAAYDDAAW